MARPEEEGWYVLDRFSSDKTCQRTSVRNGERVSHGINFGVTGRSKMSTCKKLLLRRLEEEARIKKLVR